MNLFEMLLLSRKMVFAEGRITLYKQDIVVFPPPSIMEYLVQTNNEPEATKEVYSMMKESMLDYKDEFLSSYKESSGQNWLCDVANLYSHGKIRYGDTKSITGEIFLDDSPFASQLKGKISGPVDHLVRGLIAGLASSVLDKNLDAIETECHVDGASSCKLILDSGETLAKTYLDIYAKQV